MVSEQDTFKDLTNLPYNSTTKLVNMKTDNIYRKSKGSIVDGIYEFLIKKDDQLCIYPIILEYGTYHNLRLFAWLLLENYYYCNKNKEKWPNTSQKLKSLFYINNEVWQYMVINNYIEFMDMLI